MTPNQLKQSDSVSLLNVLKNKGGCYHSRDVARRVLNELGKRHGWKLIGPISTELWHIQNEGVPTLFYDECDKVISLLTK